MLIKIQWKITDVSENRINRIKGQKEHTHDVDEVKPVRTATRERILLSSLEHKVAFQARGVSFGVTLARASFPCHYTLPQNTRTYERPYVRTTHTHTHIIFDTHLRTRTNYIPMYLYTSYVYMCHSSIFTNMHTMFAVASSNVMLR